jgi:hypothetical protein
MAPEDACAGDMLVLTRWQDRTMALSQLAAVDPDEAIAEDIVDIIGRNGLPRLNYARQTKTYGGSRTRRAGDRPDAGYGDVGDERRGVVRVTNSRRTDG